MTQDLRNWVRWIRVLSDPSEGTRGFSLAGLEFRSKHAEAVEDEMYGTLPGDTNTQPGKFWVVEEAELMKRAPKMQAYAQGRDWFFPVEFCDPFLRPEGIEPVPTRDATAQEQLDAIRTFQRSLTALGNKVS